MKDNRPISEQLKEKLWKVPEVIDLRDMIFKSAQRYGNKAAFELKNSDGLLYKLSYNQLKDDVTNLGTGLINLGLQGQAIGILGKNS